MSYPINITALIFVGVFLLSGCSTSLHKDYRFETLEKDLEWSVLHAKLRGKPIDMGSDLSVTGSPYELLVWFSAKNNETINNCEITIDSLSLVSLETGKIILINDNSKATFRKKKDDNYSASFMFKDIELEFVDYRLQITYHSSKKCSLTSDVSQVELVFHRDYQERKISFWDSLMGI